MLGDQQFAHTAALETSEARKVRIAVIGFWRSEYTLPAHSVIYLQLT